MKRTNKMFSIALAVMAFASFANGADYATYDKVEKSKVAVWGVGENKVPYTEDYVKNSSLSDDLFDLDYEYLKVGLPTDYNDESRKHGALFDKVVPSENTYWLAKDGSYFTIRETDHRMPDYEKLKNDHYDSAMMSKRYSLEKYDGMGEVTDTGKYYVRPSAVIDDDSWINLRGYDIPYNESYNAFVKVLDENTIVLTLNQSRPHYDAKILKKTSVKPISLAEKYVSEFMDNSGNRNRALFKAWEHYELYDEKPVRLK